MNCRHGLLLLIFLHGAPAMAQVQTAQGSGDLRVQAIDYDAAQIVQLRGAPGYQLMVELSSDEQVKNVALGDSGAWQVNVNKEGNRLFLKPTRRAGSTNMTVVTSVRTYNFDLQARPAPEADMPYAVAFRYPSPSQTLDDLPYVDVSAAKRRLSKYRITGDQQLRPASVTDDGRHTYIEWPISAPIPAVYAVDQSGNEVLVNGMMRTDDVYVIDGAPLLLNFRIDRALARAERLRSSGRR